jgi:hypothetical protein
MHFATRHGERIANDLGLDLSGYQIDLEGVKAGLGLEQGDGTTYRDLQERRELIRSRLQKKR